MSYRLHPSHALRTDVPAVVAREIESAVACLRGRTGNSRDPVHAARKHFKKVQALLGLVKPLAQSDALDALREHVAAAAKILSESRDAKATLEAGRALKDDLGGRKSRLYSDLMSWLRARYQRVEGTLTLASIEGALLEVEKAKALLTALDLPKQSAGVLQSAGKTYGRGRKAMKRALAHPTGDAFHAWRKQAQRHWRHALLLKSHWRKEAKARAALGQRLSDALGLHHDLDVLRETILTNRAIFRTSADVKTFSACIDRRQALLANKARRIGSKLYAEKPAKFSRRLDARWRKGA